MGLDTSHDCWHGPYSSFNNFRRALAQTINMNLDEMEGFGGSQRPFSDFDHDIIPLLDHSDCEGEITAEDCVKVARGLKAIYQELSEEDRNKYIGGYQFGEAIQNWINGCLEAALNNEPVEFH